MAPHQSSRPTMPLFNALAGLSALAGVVLLVVSETPLAGVAFLVAAAGLFLLPSVQARRARRIAATAGGGRSASARIISVHPLRPRGGVQRVRVHYEISPVSRSAYRLTTRHVVPAGMEDTFVVGRVLPVKVDPSDPKNVVLVTGDG